ncbi:MAG: hypothetical protein U5L07_17405 [Desulfobacterales bacterium]|nr:hypothetical protein [Desulfobacterales bacterium]
MNFFIQTQAPENAGGQLKSVYDTLSSMFQTVPKVFEAQSIRPDLLGPPAPLPYSSRTLRRM